jgi:hypothetical protein
VSTDFFLMAMGIPPTDLLKAFDPFKDISIFSPPHLPTAQEDTTLVENNTHLRDLAEMSPVLTNG